MKKIPINKYENLIKQPEGDYLDFKSTVYLNKDNSNEEKDKFIKDLIAFGNKSRRTGKPCYIVFGFNESNDTVRDIRYRMDDETKLLHYFKSDNMRNNFDGYENTLTNIANQWIAPSTPSFNLLYGKYEEKYVAYLEIKYTNTELPFRYKKNYKDKMGKVYIRVNSSIFPVSKTEEKFLVSNEFATYLDEKDWEKVFQPYLKGNFEESINVTPFFPLSTKGGRNLQNHVEEVVLGGEKLVAIIANPGMGKSTFLKQLAFHFANKQSTANNTSGYYDLEQSSPQEIEYIPKTQVPIYKSLNTAFSSVDEFESSIINTFFSSIATVEKPHKLSKLFNMVGTKWIIILDGLDELINNPTSNSVVKNAINSFPKNVQVVLSTRPFGIENLEKFRKIRIRSLSEGEAKNYIKQKMEVYVTEGLINNDEVNEAIRYIEKIMMENNEFQYLLNSFRTIDGLLHEYFPQKESIINKPELVTNKKIKIINDKTNIKDKPPIAIIDSDESVLPESPLQAEEDSKQIFLQPVLCQLVNGITVYMQKFEINRKNNFGFSSQPLSDNALRGLRKTAWHSNWGEPTINKEIIFDNEWMNSDDLWWNQNIGFIENYNVDNIKFQSNLIRQFFTAKFALSTQQTEKIKNNIELEFTQGMIYLLRQLCEINNHETLI